MSAGFTYVYAYSRSKRMRGDFRTVVAKDETTARRIIRERHNLRTTRGMSIVPQAIHDSEVARLAALRKGTT